MAESGGGEREASESPRAPMERPRPPVLPWYRLYCAFMATLYVLCLAGGGLLIFWLKRETQVYFGRQLA